MPRRPPKRRSQARKIIHGVKKFAKKHHAVRNLKKYGPGAAGAALTLGGIVAAGMTANPAFAAAGQVAGGAVSTIGTQALKPKKPFDYQHAKDIMTGKHDKEPSGHTFGNNSHALNPPQIKPTMDSWAPIKYPAEHGWEMM